MNSTYAQSGRRPCVVPLVWRGFFWILCAVVGMGCTTVRYEEETLADYYWQVQQLRLNGAYESANVNAWRDLGVIYLRTGMYAEADQVLSQGIALNRTDAKLWFYAGLTKELLDQQGAALQTYQGAPTLSSTSTYSKATKGRIAYLQNNALRTMLTESLSEQALTPIENLLPNTYAVIPFVCRGRGTEFTNLGKGLSEVFSSNIDQLRNFESVNPAVVRAAFESTASMPLETIEERSIFIGRILGAGKVLNGTCTISVEDRIRLELELRDLTEDRVIQITGEERTEDIDRLERDVMQSLIDELNIWIPGSSRRIPVSGVDLETLLAYSDGIALEDVGSFEESVARYQAALRRNPQFVMASVRMDIVQDKILAYGTDANELIDLMGQLEALASTEALLDARMQQLGSDIQLGFGPGFDSRRLPPGNVGELPAPPVPVNN